MLCIGICINVVVVYIYYGFVPGIIMHPCGVLVYESCFLLVSICLYVQNIEIDTGEKVPLLINLYTKTEE